MSTPFKAGDIVRPKQQGKYDKHWAGLLTVRCPDYATGRFTPASGPGGDVGAFFHEELELVPNELDVLRQHLDEQLALLEQRIASLSGKLNRIDGGVTVRPTRAPGWMAGAGSVKGDAKPDEFVIKLDRKRADALLDLVGSLTTDSLWHNGNGPTWETYKQLTGQGLSWSHKKIKFTPVHQHFKVEYAD